MSKTHATNGVVSEWRLAQRQQSNFGHTNSCSVLMMAVYSSMQLWTVHVHCRVNHKAIFEQYASGGALVNDIAVKIHLCSQLPH